MVLIQASYASNVSINEQKNWRIFYNRAVEKGGKGGPFAGANIFFPRKIGKQNFYMWITFEALFIEQDLNDKK